MAIGANMGKMIGPLPMGAWVAVVGGGLGFALYTRSRASDGSPEVPGGSPLDTVGDGSTGGAWSVTAPTPTNNPDVALITDNQSWAFATENWLIAHGYDPGKVVSSISNGLYGLALPPDEWAIWVTALAHQGAPPENFNAPTQSTPTPKPHIPTPPPPKPKPPPPKPKPSVHTYYVVRPGDNLTKIGKKFHISWQTIYSNNRSGHRRADGSMGMIRNYNLIYPGWKLLIK
jgi:nucleoid-associated protein YgaU